VQAVDRAGVPDHVPTDPGTQLQVQTQDGQAVTVVVADVTDEALFLDANHPLAGKALTFDVELVRVVRIGSQDVTQAIRSDQSETDLDHWQDWDLIIQAGSGDITSLLQSVERGLGLPLRS